MQAPRSDVRSEARKRRPRLILAFVVLGGVLLFGLIALVVSLKTYVMDGPSMSPTIEHRRRLFVLRQLWAGDPEPGDVVVLVSPRDGLEIVKRVVAVGGQTIELRGDVVYIDDRPIAHRRVGCRSSECVDCVCERETIGGRSWTTMRDAFVRPEEPRPFEVPRGHVFVLGDHRDHSNDSRNPELGAIPTSALIGRVLWL